jgi:acetyl-CoA acetyltransferase
MPRHPLHDVAIVGAYHTRQAKVLAARELDVVLDAIRGALAAANLSPAEVDGLNVRSSVWRLNPREAAAWFGGRPVWTGSALGIEGVIEAALAIATGQCETVVIADAQAGEYTDRESTSPWTRPTNEFVACWGLYTAAEFALIARRHMRLFGTKPEALAEVAATIRMVADPYHLLDCAINSEGGVGLVLTAAERAFAQCGLAPADVDVCEFYDPFSFELIRQLEAFGFCKEGLRLEITRK